jgi:hypothetical protein
MPTVREFSMRNRLYTIMAGAALAAAVPAQAVTLTFTNSLAVRPGLALLNDFTVGTPRIPENSGGVFVVESGGGGSGGSVKNDQSGNVFGTPANPYLEIKGGTYTRTFAPKTVRAFSFLFQGLDEGTDNNVSSLTINLSTGASAIFGDLQSVLGGGLGRAYVDTTSRAYITSVVFRGRVINGRGNGAQYNIDGFATAAPEPATWGMLILGFGMAGLGLRRRAKAPVVA